MFSPHTILHPTDFSECSNYALQIAADLATQHGARIIVLHVVETLGPENATFGEVASQLEPEGYRARLEADLRQVRPSVAAGVRVEYLLIEGDPASEIQRMAKEQRCDLIVMGTHGRRGWERLMIGSVAEQVVRTAPCSVLVARPDPKPA